MFLSWKVKVVLSIKIIILWLTSTSVLGQFVEGDLLEKRVTLSCHHIPCESAFQLLTKKTNISFVYSTSMLDLQKPVSLSFYKTPLREILESIAHHMNLSFKLEGDHVVIKKLTESQPHAKPTISPKEINELPSAKETSPLNTSVHTTSASLSILQTFDEASRMPSLDLAPYQLDSSLSTRTARLLARMQRQMLSVNDSYAKETSSIQKKWFAATSLFVNDFTISGLEVQGGINSFFAVLNASRINNELYRFGYGAGTSLPITSRWSLQMIYTAAKITKEKNFAFFPDAIKLTSWHHQIKLLSQYSLSHKISLRAGITFNVLNTRYKFMDANVPLVMYRQQHEPSHSEPPRLSYLSEVLRSSNTIIAPYTLSNTYSDNFYLNTKTWIGVEIAVAYRINFSSRP